MRNDFTPQRGALFGMDARLALMVFTVLSGIVGYFSYGRIMDVRTTALIKELEAYDKALQHYQTDMGVFIPDSLTPPRTASDSDFTVLWQQERVQPARAHRWNGPYVTISSHHHPYYGTITLSYATAEMRRCTPHQNCYVYLNIDQVPLRVWRDVNRRFDRSQANSYSESAEDGHTSGKIRAEKQTDPVTLSYQTTVYQEGFTAR